MSAVPILELRNVSKRFTGVTAVAGLSFAVYPGHVLCLLGENGAGKSTVIKLITGVDLPSSGEVLIDGHETHLTSPRQARELGIATVYQEVSTLPLLSVARNFVLAAEPTKGWGMFRRMDLREAERLALESLQSLGISRVRDGRQLVGTLSGGERQALAIGRAVHFGARLLVLDEPTAALGIRESATVLRLIRKVRARGVAVIFITHNPYHAYSAGDQFVVLRRGEALASFAKSERSVAALIELMAGGTELNALLAEDEESGAIGI